MGAREKLNGAYVNGSLIISGAIGFITESWAVFFIVLLLMLAANIFERNLR